MCRWGIAVRRRSYFGRWSGGLVVSGSQELFKPRIRVSRWRQIVGQQGNVDLGGGLKLFQSVPRVNAPKARNQGDHRQCRSQSPPPTQGRVIKTATVTCGARDRAAPTRQATAGTRGACQLQAQDRLRHLHRLDGVCLTQPCLGNGLLARDAQSFRDVVWQALSARLEVRANTQSNTGLQGLALRFVQRVTGCIFHNEIPRE